MDTTAVVGFNYGFVVALYNYAARKPTEMSFKKGDVLGLLRPPDDSGWWYGRNCRGNAGDVGGGEEGLFAHNYVKQLTLELHVARHAFRGKGEDEAYLPFAHGELLEVVLPDANGWWLARKAGGGRLGLVPANYIAPATNANEEKEGDKEDSQRQQQQPTPGTDVSSGNEEPTATTQPETSASDETAPPEEGGEVPSMVSATGTEEVLPPSALLDAALAQLLPERSASGQAGGHGKKDSGHEGPAAGDWGDQDESADFVGFLRDQLQRREQLAARLADLLKGGDPHPTPTHAS